MHILNPTVLVAALGYFVDIYDLVLFGIVRVASLKGIGLPPERFLEVGIYLINLQMTGMLVGGLLWGVIGDKKGRVSVLFGSILLYSVANLLNAFVTSVEAYGVLRFLAGVGLAGELGAAVTLVSETLGKERRGLGTTAVATVGLLGAVCAGVVGEIFTWKTCYLIGGVMGLLLLIMRLSIYESGMYTQLKQSKVKKGDLRMLFYPRSRFMKYLACILIGVPIWFVTGILITFSPEFAIELKVIGQITAAKSILFYYFGASLGGIVAGTLSQLWESRKNVIFLFLGLIFSFVSICLLCQSLSSPVFYLMCIALGASTGYWVVLMTMTAEQFGTNLRATVTTSVPNFVRASVVILTFAFQMMRSSMGLIQSAWLIGTVTIGLALAANFGMHDSFAKDLDYTE